GHVHLKVTDLERALRFYCDVLGFAVIQRCSRPTALISAGGYHHVIGLNTRESEGGMPPPKGMTGICHVAILYPTSVRQTVVSALVRGHSTHRAICKPSNRTSNPRPFAARPGYSRSNARSLLWVRLGPGGVASGCVYFTPMSGHRPRRTRICVRTRVKRLPA